MGIGRTWLGWDNPTRSRNIYLVGPWIVCIPCICRHKVGRAGLKANELLLDLLAEQSHGVDYAFLQGDSSCPAQRG